MKNFKSIGIAAVLTVLLTVAHLFSQAVANPPKESESGKCVAANSNPNVQNFIEKSLKKLHFLEGNWKIENKENYETWKINSDCSLEGKAFKIRAEKEIITEYLLIKVVDKNVTYHATVANQNNGQTIEFVLNNPLKDKVSFENLTHDFPKKIQYTKLDETTLFVEVLGENDKGFSFKMIKQKL
jgi:hypothetical protein